MESITTDKSVNRLSFSSSEALVSSFSADHASLNESGLIRKALARLSPESDLLFEFTTQPDMLHQYFLLRKQMYIDVWGLSDFSDKADAFDAMSEIMVVRKKLQCVAGCRLTISSAANRIRLPLEKDDFTLESIFPELALSNRSYCEFSRLSILPDFRGGKVLPEMSHRCIRRAIAEGVDYAFNMAPVPLARNYKQTLLSLGMDCEIRRDIVIPDREEFEGIKMVLSVMDLTGAKPNHVSGALSEDECISELQS